MKTQQELAEISSCLRSMAADIDRVARRGGVTDDHIRLWGEEMDEVKEMLTFQSSPAPKGRCNQHC